VDMLPVLHSLRLPDTPMHNAASKGDSRRVTSLAGYGVDVNCQDQVGDTPLHRAVRHHKIHTSKKLVELGADISSVNDGGVSVGTDMMVHFDSAQREAIQGKLLEREEKRHRMDVGKAEASAWGKSPTWSEAEEEDLSYMQQTSAIPLMSLITNPGADSTRQKRPLHFKPDNAGQSSMPSPVLAHEDAGASRAKKSSKVSQTSSTVTTNVTSPTTFTPAGKQWSSTAFAEGLASPADELPARPALHHPESEEENAKNPGDPSDCNPDDAHNLSTRPDQWAAHPVRLVCMQVDAWVSTLPGVRVWQTSKHVGPLQAMLRKPSDLSENIAWRVGEARAMRERWMREVNSKMKLLGTVTKEIVHGDYKGLAESMQAVPVSQKMKPWVTRHATRWAMRVCLLRQTARSASVVVSELVRGKPGNVQNVIREQADVIAQTYKVSLQQDLDLHPARAPAATA